MAKLIDILMPDSEQGSAESVMERWFKQVGDYVKMHEPILEISTDKVTVEVAAPSSGILKEVLVEVNDPIESGTVLGRIEVVAEQMVETEEKPKSVSSRRKSGGGDGGRAQQLSPAVRRLLKQHNLDISQVHGSGGGGRITAEDIENYLQQKTAQITKPSEIPSQMVPHTPVRRQMASHMVESMLKTAPHVTDIFDVDLSAIIAHREKVQAEFKQKGVKLTYTAYFVDAMVKAIQVVPQANSRWHEDALEIFDDYNIGVATATENGLVVPVVHQAQKLDLWGIAKRLQDVVNLAREGKLKKENVANGTFTITNHGVSGSLIATPIIHQPQSAILGIGKMEKRAVVIEKDGRDSIEIRPMTYVTLTIDHRVLDGFQANTCLSKVVETLSSW